MKPASLKTLLFLTYLFLMVFLFSGSVLAQYTPEEYLEKGKEYHQQGNLAKAIDHYSYTIQLKSDCASCYYNRGLALLEMGKYHKSRYDFDQVLKINPADTDAYEQRGGVHYLLGNYDKAISDFTFVILAKPQANIYINRGMAYLEQVKYNDALRDLENAMNMNEDDPEAYRVIGDTYFAKGEAEQAIEYYSMALNKDPDDQKTLNNRGNTYQQLGMNSLALADYDHAVAVTQNSHTYTNRAKFWLNQGEYDKALVDCRRASQLDYKNAEAYYYIGQVENAKGNTQRALSNFNKAVEINDQRADFYNGRGLALFKLNEFEDALDDFKQAVAIDPSDAAAKDRILDCRERLESYADTNQGSIIKNTIESKSTIEETEIFTARGIESANDDIQGFSWQTNPKPKKEEKSNNQQQLEGLKNNQNQPSDTNGVSSQQKAQKYIELGDFYVGSNDYAEALQHYESAIWHDKYSKTAYLKKAQCLISLQQNNDALLAMDQHLKFHNNEAEAYYMRGSLRFRTGNIFGAKEDYDLGLQLNKNHSGLLESRAQWNADKGYYLKAVDDYSRLIQIAPQANNYYQRGMMWFKLKMYNKSIKDYTEAILGSDVEKSDFYLARGIAYQFNNASELALFDLDKTIALSPRLSKAYLYRAAAKSSLGDQQGTCMDFEIAKSLGYKAIDKIDFVSHCK